MTAVVDEYQAQTEQLAAGSETLVLAIYAQLAAGEIETDTAVLLIAVAINRANAAAVTLSDISLAVQIEVLARRPVPAIGVVPTETQNG